MRLGDRLNGEVNGTIADLLKVAICVMRMCREKCYARTL